MTPAHQKQGRGTEWLGVALLLAYAAILFSHPQPPSLTDYANWTYQGVLLCHHLQGIGDPFHALKTYPVPNSASTLGIGLFALVVSWVAAAKLWLCLQIAISLACLRHLAHTVAADAAVWFLVPQAIFFGVNWWYGFVNFELGIAWVLLIASMLLRRLTGTQRDWPLGMVLLAAFLTHMIPFAFCGLLLLLYARQTKRWRILWQIAPAAALSLWYVIGRYLEAGDADGRAGMVATVRNYTAAFWIYKANSYLKSFGFVNPEGSAALGFFGRTIFLLLLAVTALLAAVMATCLLRSALSALRQGAPERFLWTGILLLMPLYLLAPGAALGVSDPGSRLLQSGLALGLVLCCGRAGVALHIGAACSTTLAVAALLLFARFGFGPGVVYENPLPIPHLLGTFSHVPNHDQDYFYRALERGDDSLEVFPTGMFLNRSRPR